MENNPFYGAIPENPPDTDYQLVAGVFDLPTPRHTFAEKGIQYNQKDIGLPVGCTIVSKATQVSNLTGYRYPDSELQKLWKIDLAYPKDPANNEVGGYQSTAVDIVRDNFHEPLVSFRINLISPEADLAFEKGYMLDVLYHGNEEFNLDHYIDGILNQTKLTGLSTYGHNISAVIMKKGDMYKVMVDNYSAEGSTLNTYSVPSENLKALVANGVFSPQSYVFALQADIDHPVTNVSPFAVNSWQKASKKGIVTGKSNPQSKAGTKWDELLLYKAGFLTSILGTLSLERKIVAMDRAGLLE